MRARWEADLGLATTGVAGPEPQAGHPVGEVYVALADAGGAASSRLAPGPVGGPPSEGQRSEAAVQLLLERLGLAEHAAWGASLGPRRGSL